MNLQKNFRRWVNFLKIASVCGAGSLFITYHVRQTCKVLQKIVNSDVLDIEKKHTAEFIYIEDPLYNIALKKEHEKASRKSVSLGFIWKSLKHSLAWRLLWLCRHGNREQRNIALQQLAAFKNNKNWDCLKLAQALDKNTAVLLARTSGADSRYFLPPPIHVRRAASSQEFISFKFRDMICAIQKIKPHSCIQHFLSKYFANEQDHIMEADSVPAKPDSISERDLCILCLDIIHHHISLFNQSLYADDHSASTLVGMGLLPKLAELLLRYHNDSDVDLAVLRVLTVLSAHTNLLTDFFQNGLIRDLCRFIKSKDIKFSSSAAVCLTNLSGEYCYRPGMFLLYPIYRTTTPHACDILLVHGLRGGVFVTWRQRDKKCSEPLGILEVTNSDLDSNSCEKTSIIDQSYMDPELQQVIEEFRELDEEALLSEYDVILQDVPVDAKREPKDNSYSLKDKRLGLVKEDYDRCNYTFCWPKEWLPNDCNNLRILGVNYWSSLSEWLDRCPLQTADIPTRAAELIPNLVDAGVGKANTPVVWLAHSMGGLLVKKVLIEAAVAEDHKLKSLSECTKAVLFYSTPHKGSSLASMPRAASAILWPSTDVKQLQENSPMLLELHNSFIKYADLYDWETISFAETLPTLVTAFKVPVHFVPASSADVGRGVFYQLNLDHLSICKPATRQSVLYTTVLDTLLRITHQQDAQLRYTNPLLWWIMNIFWKIMNVIKTKVTECEDEPLSADDWSWFERTILYTFTDF